MPGFAIGGAGSGPSATNDVLRRHKWSIDIIGGSGLDLQPIRLAAHKVSRPKPKIDVIKMHRGQDVIKLPGKNEWPPATFTFYEALEENANVCDLLYKWWSETVVVIKDSKIVGENLKRQIDFSLYSECGDPSIKYSLGGCWISDVSPDDLDYASSDLLSTTITIEYDKATQRSN